MARIHGVPPERAGWLAWLAYRYSKRKLGKIAEPIAVAAHHPAILCGTGAFEVALERSHRLDPKLKTLAAIEAAAMVGCPFCLDIGSAIGRTHGISEQQLRELARYRDSTAFSELEKLVIAYAEAMSRTPLDVPDELFAELRRRFDDAQIVELTAEIAWENYRARFNYALDIPVQGFSKGECALPVSAA